MARLYQRSARMLVFRLFCMPAIDPASFCTMQEIVADARRKLAPGPWAYLAVATETETTMRTIVSRS